MDNLWEIKPPTRWPNHGIKPVCVHEEAISMLSRAEMGWIYSGESYGENSDWWMVDDDWWMMMDDDGWWWMMMIQNGETM